MLVLSNIIWTSIIILFIIVLRFVFGSHLSKKTFMVLWWIIIIRFLLPQNVIRLPLLFADTKLSKGIAYLNSLIFLNIENADMVLNIKNSITINGITTLWSVISIFLFIFFFGIHFYYKKKYKFAVSIENKYIQDWKINQNKKIIRKIKAKQIQGINTALTYGIVKPVILIPEGEKWSDPRYIDLILEHEWNHIKHFDALLKLLLSIVICIYWFNPFIWIMYIIEYSDAIVHAFR